MRRGGVKGKVSRASKGSVNEGVARPKNKNTKLTGEITEDVEYLEFIIDTRLRVIDSSGTQDATNDDFTLSIHSFADIEKRWTNDTTTPINTDFKGKKDIDTRVPLIYKVDWGDGNINDYTSNPYTSFGSVKEIDERITSSPKKDSFYLNRDVEEAYAFSTIVLNHTYDNPGEYIIKVVYSADSYVGWTWFFTTMSMNISSRSKRYFGSQVKDIVRSTFLEKYKNNKIRLFPSWGLFAAFDSDNLPSEGISAMPINFAPPSKVESLHARFSGLNYYSDSTVDVDLGSWDTSSIKNMSLCFSLSKANFIGIENLDTGSVTDMTGCFTYNHLSSNTDLSNWDTSEVVDMSILLNGITISSGVTLNLSGWDTSKVQNLTDALSSMNIDDNAVDVSGWETSNVKTMRNLANNTDASVDLSGWDVGRSLSFFRAFSSCSSNPDITGWNIGENVPSNITHVYKIDTGNTAVGGNDPDCTDSLFRSGEFRPDFPDKLTKFLNNHLYVGIDFSKMFSANDTFNRDISGWDTSKVSNFNEMFQNATSFNQDLSSWDWSGVPDGGKVCGRNPKMSPWSENAFYDMFKGSGMSTSNINKVITSMYNHVVATGHPINMLCEHAFNSVGNTRTLMTADDPTIDAKITTLVDDYNWEINIPA
ncbi:MAG: hypothetical protein Unbinned4409contig1001_6 [Prokaryotic dsDNA virus sp.]|nr:MAG: hypothetical protein Unbinned4409contig1001_6 [Prokaryotic dsDNA virus sp.]|tara:strand:- start:180 stop:2123 length:1944 start_codon:yes stop_codon:yes gene_type:complete